MREDITVFSRLNQQLLVNIAHRTPVEGRIFDLQGTPSRQSEKPGRQPGCCGEGTANPCFRLNFL
jgi:hypothetical protein